ncbi:unnamed protein product [Scytosiphon promiscuus]
MRRPCSSLAAPWCSSTACRKKASLSPRFHQLLKINEQTAQHRARGRSCYARGLARQARADGDEAPRE